MEVAEEVYEAAKGAVGRMAVTTPIADSPYENLSDNALQFLLERYKHTKARLLLDADSIAPDVIQYVEQRIAALVEIASNREIFDRRIEGMRK